MSSVRGHTPVFVQEISLYLNIKPYKTYLDATFGTGGHTKAILNYDPTCSVIAVDWDKKALDRYGVPLQEEFGDRLVLLWGNFAHLYKLLKKNSITAVDGILADFGTSQVQIFEGAGFSVYRDTPLDMRMSPAHQKVTAAQLLKEMSERDLRELFWDYGEERFAKKIAHAIVQERVPHPIATTRQLAHLIERIVPKNKLIHPATRVFQALRIYVNKELDNIRAFLASAFPFINSGGRFVCISFHSLEDRLVKQFFKAQVDQQQARLVTPKVVKPTQQEIAENPAARSAKLRAIEKL